MKSIDNNELLKNINHYLENISDEELIINIQRRKMQFQLNNILNSGWVKDEGVDLYNISAKFKETLTHCSHIDYAVEFAKMNYSYSLDSKDNGVFMVKKNSFLSDFLLKFAQTSSPVFQTKESDKIEISENVENDRAPVAA